jgi:hypothetical protein
LVKDFKIINHKESVSSKKVIANICLAKLRNDGETPGVVTVLIATWGKVGETCIYSFMLLPGEAKEIRCTHQSLYNFQINTGISRYFPTTLTERSVPLFKQEVSVTALKEIPEEPFHVKIIDPTLLDDEMTGEVVVDNLDPGFRLESEERILQELFREDRVSRQTSAFPLMRADVTRWTELPSITAYGKYARGFHYKMGGEGAYKAIWKHCVEQPGRYEIKVLMYDKLFTSTQSDELKYYYAVRYEGKTHEVEVKHEQEEFVNNQTYPDGTKVSDRQASRVRIPSNGTWKSLGVFDLAAGEVEVILSDKGDPTHRIIADAVKWVKVE